MFTSKQAYPVFACSGLNPSTNIGGPCPINVAQLTIPSFRVESTTNSFFINVSNLFTISVVFDRGVPTGKLISAVYVALSFDGKNILGIILKPCREMIKMTNSITLDLRTDLINKLISAKYQNFEELETGQILTTLNEDTTVIASSANMLIGAITNFITAFSAFLYLTSISVQATLVVLGVVLLMTIYYYIISKISRRFMEEARDAQNDYMELLNSLNQGFKELSLHFLKKKEYRQDLLAVCIRYCQKNIHQKVIQADTGSHRSIQTHNDNPCPQSRNPGTDWSVLLTDPCKLSHPEYRNRC